MTLAAVTSFAIDGVETRRVIVEADIRLGLPAFNVVGHIHYALRFERMDDMATQQLTQWVNSALN